jgi:XTP/dITP diphosphohydrolase
LRGEEGILKELKESVYFATKNRSKYLEVVGIASSFGIDLKHLNIEKLEIQSEKLNEIASFAAMRAAKSSNRRVVAEDAGLFIEAWGGFPGPYSSYVFKTLGNEAILKLMRNVDERKAAFRAAIAYCKPGQRPVCFEGTARGIIGRKQRGTLGFGFDPIFIPSSGDGRTFAQMTTCEKGLFSHRAMAFAKFSKWYTSAQRHAQTGTS